MPPSFLRFVLLMAAATSLCSCAGSPNPDDRPCFIIGEANRNPVDSGSLIWPSDDNRCPSYVEVEP